MTETIHVYIGDGSHIDGGPFENVTIDTHTEENLVTPEGHTIPRHMVQRAVNDLANGHPVSLTAVAKDDSFMSVTVPISEGVMYETNGQLATGAELQASGDIRQRFGRSFRDHGGEIGPN